MLRYITSFAFLLLSIFSFGQGSIAGIVTDAKTKEAVIGANVLVVGTSKGASTDIEGKFLISNIEAGTYQIQISYLAYKTNTVADVVVEDAKRVTLDVPLAEESTELGEVIVTSGRTYDTDFELLRSIKEMKLVVVGVTAEQIGKTLDRDAAQVIRRVPGITIMDGQFVQIRGLAARYNPVLLHNVYAPSVETDVRSFSFATLPSSQLERMLVFKSAAADIPGDFAGGVVKVFTKSVPDENGVIIDYSTQVRAGTTFKDYYHQEKNKGYFTGFNTGHYGLPSGFPANASSVSGTDLENLGRSLPNNWVPQKSTATPDQRFTITSNRKFNLGKVEVGNISAINYSNSFLSTTVERNDFSEDGTISPNYNYTDKQYNQLVRTGFLFNWLFKFTPTSKIEFKNMYNQSSADQYVDRFGSGESAGQRNGAFDKSYRGIYSGQLLGSHDLLKGRTTFEWVAGYNNSYRDQPDYRRFRSAGAIDGNPAQIYIPFNVSPDYLGRFYSKTNESAYSGGASILQRFGGSDALKSLELKAGVFFENKKRSFNARSLGYTWGTTANDELPKLAIDQLFQPQNFNNSTGIQLNEVSDPKNSYTATNNLLAYYVMGSLPIGEKFKIDAGARVEDNTQKLENKVAPADLHVLRLLPSANLSYNFTEKMLVRAAYGQTLNRPEFREIAAFSFYDFNYNFIYSGNSTLKTATIQNIDLRWEYYPSKGEMITFGGFYKHFKDPIEPFIGTLSGGGGIKDVSYQNAPVARSFGVEVEVKKSLNGLTGSSILNNMNVLLNGAFIYSRVTLTDFYAQDREKNRPMQGQAPYVVNAAVFYTSPQSGWQINALYNVVGKSIVFVGNKYYKDVYLMPRQVIDLTFSKEIGTHFKLKGGISDILNQSIHFLQDGNNDKTWDRKNDQTVQKFKPGQVFSLGFSVNIP